MNTKKINAIRRGLSINIDEAREILESFNAIDGITWGNLGKIAYAQCQVTWMTRLLDAITAENSLELVEYLKTTVTDSLLRNHLKGGSSDHFANALEHTERAYQSDFLPRWIDRTIRAYQDDEPTP